MLPLAKSQTPTLLTQARTAESAGRLAEARAGYERVLTIDKGEPRALFHLGQLCLKEGDAAAAIPHLAGAAQRAPSERAVWELYARAVRDGGSGKAIAQFVRAISAAAVPKEVAQALKTAVQAKDPAFLRARIADAARKTDTGQPDAAFAILNQILKHVPDIPDGLFEMGRALRAKRALAGAIEALKRGHIADPSHAGIIELLARLYTETFQFEQALALLERLEDGGQDIALLHATTLSGLGRDTDALARLDALPVNGKTRLARARILQSLGQFDTARALYLDGISAEPGRGQLYFGYVSGKKVAAEDPIVDKMIAQWGGAQGADRINLGFALAKAFEDTKTYDKVFPYLTKASALVRKAYPFDMAAFAEGMRAQLSRLEGQDYRAEPPAGASGFAPIFVTGLPRSGTTLVEQILAGHSQVAAGGELGFARSALADLLSPKRAIQDVPAEDLSQQGHKIAERMRARVGDAPRLTDKSVLSYTLAGPIRLALPKARFVLVTRDPRDNLLSLYKNLFNEGQHLYSYDLRDLARYHRLYEEVIAFWDEVAPGVLYKVRYEDPVADPEPQIRALLEAVGLDWEPGCMEFHKSTRRVDTLSVHQVRQPLYSSSIGAWRRFESELAPLLTALEEG